MPIVAIAGMIGGVSALAAGGLTVLQTISAIGGILGGIGAITGNKKLAAVGAIAGVAGGIGAFAQGKGWLADPSASGTASGAADASFIEAAKAAPSGAEGGLAETAATGDFGGAAGSNSLELGQVDFGQAAQQTTGGLATTQSITDTLSQSNPLASQAMGAPPSGLAGAGDPAASTLAQQSPVLDPSGTAASVPGMGQAGPTLSKAELDGTNAFGANSVSNAYSGIDATGKTGGDGGILGMFKDFGGFLERNKQLASMAGNFIGGMFDSEKEAREEYLRARTDTERQQMANANSVPKMGFQSTPKSGGTFRQTQPTYRPVQIAGGLYNAR